MLIAALVAAATPAAAFDLIIGGRVEQGGLLVGTAPPGAKITFAGHTFTTADGRFVVGFDRDAKPQATLTVTAPDGAVEKRMLTIKPRQWQVERVDGVPQQLVTPDPELEKRIINEQHMLDVARTKIEALPLFESGFMLPAEGRHSGFFGSQRILNGTPRAPHAGLDIAVPIGTPVHAAADGVVSLQQPDMVMTGYTVMLNHGEGLQTMYIHMSKILVQDGQHVKQGDVIGLSGMTGRANGPHVHFAATWFNSKIDPETLLAVLPAKTE
jgi:murein DD-endopeptidase MepM/ murein hydrolase activator NlpD